MAAFAWKAQPRWRRVVIVLAGVVAMLALAVWIASIVLRPHLPTSVEVTARAREQADLSGGAKAYATHCGYCHDRAIGPAIGGRGLDAATLTAMVRNGPGSMPAFPQSLVSDDDIAAIAKYLTTQPPPTPPPTPPKDGK